MHDDTPFNRNDYNAARMIAGYRPDHYRELGGIMTDKDTYHVETITDVVAVHIFSTKVIVIDVDGNHTEYRTVG